MDAGTQGDPGCAVAAIAECFDSYRDCGPLPVQRRTEVYDLGAGIGTAVPRPEKFEITSSQKFRVIEYRPPAAPCFGAPLHRDSDW